MTSDHRNDFDAPDPILDALELDLIAKLAFEYEKFTSPGVVARSLGTALKWTQRAIARMTPEKVQRLAKDAIDAAQDAELIKMALTYASRGFGELTKQVARFTLSPDDVVQTLRKDGYSVARYEAICAMRSYSIERSLSSREWKDRVAAVVEGAVTGAPGFVGIPFNITLSFFYFSAQPRVPASTTAMMSATIPGNCNLPLR
jgi:valyl-tRNA synthetase